MLKEANQKILFQLQFILNDVSDEEYQQPIVLIDNKSIGDHVRHILEFYDCVLQPNQALFSYDYRKRDNTIAVNRALALEKIEAIHSKIEAIPTDENIQLVVELNGESKKIPSSVERELVYLLEHSIHHFAIIKMVLKTNFPKVNLPDHFGIAFSTIAYQEKND